MSDFKIVTARQPGIKKRRALDPTIAAIMQLEDNQALEYSGPKAACVLKVMAGNRGLSITIRKQINGTLRIWRVRE